VKTLVVFFSLNGNTAKVAETVKNELKADVLELNLLKKRRPGPITFLWGILQGAGNKKPALKPYTADIDRYDLIVLGAPVWASGPASPINTFLAKTKITGKKIALFCCHAGSPGETIEKIKAQIPGNTVVAEKDFNFSKKSGAAAIVTEAIAEWAKTLAAIK
jgi:flavodoxin